MQHLVRVDQHLDIYVISFDFDSHLHQTINGTTNHQKIKERLKKGELCCGDAKSLIISLLLLYIYIYVCIFILWMANGLNLNVCNICSCYFFLLFILLFFFVSLTMFNWYYHLCIMGVRRPDYDSHRCHIGQWSNSCFQRSVTHFNRYACWSR